MEYRVTMNGIEGTARYSEQAVNGIFLPLLKTLAAMRQAKGKRLLVMLAAPPGAGKSTLLSFLERLARDSGMPEAVQAIGMDGFHRRQEDLLRRRVWRDGKQISMVEIKGAPITFDLARLTDSVKQAAAGKVIGWPVYDRLLHNPVENALRVDGSIVLLEGNYLLLNEEGWRDLAAYADYTVFIRADEQLLRTRLIERRIRTGVERNAAVRFVDFSDMPNVRTCLEKSMPANLQLWIDAQDDYHIAQGGGALFPPV
ncbi:MAG: nucleoside/nucleotide kinase family protein [Clostridia bacterium]|nr:nucleoside/nucleotide kinase family protein [Clostridia bacterium]